MTFYIPIGILILEKIGGLAHLEKKDKDGKIDNRNNILQCAKQLFYARGYDAVGVQEIVKEAGITKPTLYYYFKSKFGLLEALLEEKCKPLLKELQCIQIKGNDIAEALYQIAKVYFITSSQDKEFYFLMVSSFYSARENDAYKAIKPYMVQQFVILRDIFDQASWLLGNMHGRQEQFALGFLGTINLYILAYYEKEVSGNKLVDDRILYSLVHQFMHGIFS